MTYTYEITYDIWRMIHSSSLNFFLGWSALSLTEWGLVEMEQKSWKKSAVRGLYQKNIASACQNEGEVKRKRSKVSHILTLFFLNYFLSIMYTHADFRTWNHIFLLYFSACIGKMGVRITDKWCIKILCCDVSNLTWTLIMLP